MIGIGDLVYVIVGLLVGGLILGLLWWLINYCEKEFPGFPMIFKVIRIVFVILVVLVLISLLLHLVGYPVVRFHEPAPAVYR